MTGSALRVARSLTWLLDAVAIASLAAVPEVHPAMLAVVVALFVISRVGSRVLHFGEGVLTILLALISAATLIVILSSRVPIVVAIAHAAPIFHALLWFARGGLRDLWLRVSVGFVELILASALTAEFYLPLAILTFAISSALMMSSTFVVMTAGAGGESANLPRNYLPRAFLHTLVIIATAVLVFPLLPRGQALGGVDFRQGRVGYTEDVSVTGEKSLIGEGGGDVVLRMYFVDGNDAFNTDLLTDVYMGLLRGRALSHFDGINWSAESRVNRSPAVAEAPGAHDDMDGRENQAHFANLELIREPLTEVLPVPYGVRYLWMFSNSGFTLPIRLATGEWTDPAAASFRIRYRAVLDLERALRPFGSGIDDVPTDDTREVPQVLRTERMTKLAERLFPKDGNQTVADKVHALQNFMATQHFSVWDGSPEETAEDPFANVDGRTTRGWSNLERFIFVSKRGHCELFATAAAMLLRLGGIPTRLVSGFRVSHFPSGGVLSVRSGDAHAWVEYWIPGGGWRPLDVTPRMTLPFSVANFFRERYETLANYWYRYIFKFDGFRGRSPTLARIATPMSPLETRIGKSAHRLFTEGRELLIRALTLVSLLLIITLFVAWSWFPWLFTIRARVREGPSWLKRERIRMERLLRRRLGSEDLEAARVGLPERFGHEAGSVFEEWIGAYYRARFGRPAAAGDPGPAADGRTACVTSLKDRRRALAAVQRGDRAA